MRATPRRPSSRLLLPLILVASLAPLFAPALSSRARAEEAVTVAVAYFDNTAAAPELDVLRKGIADMLITDLAQVEGLRLVEREHLEALLKEIQLGKGPYLDPKTAQKLGKGLGAGLLIAGSFLSLSPTLRIDARVLSVETGEVLATAAAEGPGAEFFGVQSQLALKLVEALGARVTVLGKARILKPRTRSLDALSAYARGLDAEDHGDHKAAEQAFSRALSVDPEFSRAREQLAALEKRVAELEQRTTALESAGGYILKPQSAIDWFGNAQVASQKGDGKRQLESFLAGWRAMHAPGAKLPLMQLLRVLPSFSYGAATDVEARAVLETVERSARDEALPAERRSLYALITGGAVGARILEALAARHGFAAWCLGLLRESELRRDLSSSSAPAAVAGGSGAATPMGASQRRLMVAVMVPVLPFLEACGSVKGAIANCLVPAPVQATPESLLLWVALGRAHGGVMRAFADGKGEASTLDDAGLALLRRYLLVSIDLVERAVALADAHPLSSPASGADPDEKGARAYADRLLALAAARPAGASSTGEPRPASLVLPEGCMGQGGPAWARVRAAEELSEAEFADDADRPMLWTPRKLCQAIDGVLRIEGMRRFLDSRGWASLVEPEVHAPAVDSRVEARLEALSWLTLDALDVTVREGALQLDRGLFWSAPPRPRGVGCNEVIGALNESAAARIGSAPLERIARWSMAHARKCPLLPDREAVRARADCEADRAPECVKLAGLRGAALRTRRSDEGPERGFWAASERLLRARCDRDRAFCSDLGEAWLEASEVNVADDPRRPAGLGVLQGACKAGSLEACLVIAVHHVDGRHLPPSADAAITAVRGALDLAQRECDQGRPCLAQLDASKRCAAGDRDHCELLVWMITVTARGRSSDVRSLRREAESALRELAAACKSGDPAACALGADPFLPLAVPVGYHEGASARVLDEIEQRLMAPIVRGCQEGSGPSCVLLADYHAMRAARLASRAGDPDGEARSRLAARAAWDRAVVAFEKSCRGGRADQCPRWITLERRCAGDEPLACGLLVDELAHDLSFRREVSSCRDSDPRRCVTDSYLERIREEGRGYQRALARSCPRDRASGTVDPDPLASLRCELSRLPASFALPHVPEAVRPLTGRLCPAVQARCNAAPGGKPPTYCRESYLKELCRP